MNNKTENTTTPYDDVHWTMLNDCPKLIIPVVNEMFHKRHSNTEDVKVLNSEFFINKQNGKQIALQASEVSGDKLTVQFPNTAILYLRHNKNTPSLMQIEIRVPGTACSYCVPVMYDC